MNLSEENYTPVVPKVHCCICDLLIEYNPSNMCPQCLTSRVNVTDDIQKEYILIYCPECERYLQPPKYWMRADLESRELLTLCLKRIKGLNTTSGNNSNTNKGKLTDAKFLWTEPHSKRIKLKLTVQKEVFNNIVIQQACVIEYVVTWQQCPTCQKISTGQPQWDACVQLRQKVEHKKTFLYLEQVILKKRLHENFTRVEAQPGGLDFFFGHKSHALNFLEFLNRSAPVQRRDAVQLVSHDSKNNTAVQHYTYSLEIAPLCREDLVLLPYQDYYLRSLGGLGPLVIVHKVYSSIVFLDPKTLRAGEITGTLFWKKPFPTLMSSRQMVEFYVLECQLLPVTNGKYQLGLATVCLSTEVGEGREWIVQTHLGGLLGPGDLVMGYLLDSQVFNNDELDSNNYKPEQLQDVILVRKYFPSQKNRRNKRIWKMKKLDIVTNQGDSTGIVRQPVKGVRNNASAQNQYDEEAEFEDEVERDPELRKDIALYRMLDGEIQSRVQKATVENDENDWEDDDEVPEVPLEELLDELQIDENEEVDQQEDNTATDPAANEDVDNELMKRKRVE